MTITVNELTAAAQMLVAAEVATAAAEAEHKTAKERERVLREETLPAMMQELGVEKMLLTDGSEITCKQEVYASVPENRKAEAYGWLEANGHGGLIKMLVSVEFGRGELEKAGVLFKELQGAGHDPQFKRDVHSQTLKAFLKEQLATPKAAEDFTEEELAQGCSPLSLEMFGARAVMTAKVKAKK